MDGIDHKIVRPYCTEEIEDLLVMLSQCPAWCDDRKATVTMGKVEVDRLIATALKRSK